MSVCLLSYPLGSRGGVYQWTRGVAALLDSVDVLVIAGSRPAAFDAPTWEWEGSHVLVDLPRIPSLAAARAILAILEQREIQTLITSQLYSNVLGALIRSKLGWGGRHLAVVHSAITGSVIRRTTYKVAMMALAEGFDGVGIVAPHLRCDLPRQLAKRAVLCPTFTFSGANQRTATSPSRAGTPCFGFVGRLEEGKGLALFIECARRNRDAQFHVYGDGTLAPALAAEQERTPNLYAHGWVLDLEEAWDAMDILLLPSEAEGWPLTVGEAAARGVAAVVRDLPVFMAMNYPVELRASSDEHFLEIVRSLTNESNHISREMQNRLVLVAQAHFSPEAALRALISLGLEYP